MFLQNIAYDKSVRTHKYIATFLLLFLFLFWTKSTFAITDLSNIQFTISANPVPANTNFSVNITNIKSTGTVEIRTLDTKSKEITHTSAIINNTTCVQASGPSNTVACTINADKSVTINVSYNGTSFTPNATYNLEVYDHDNISVKKVTGIYIGDVAQPPNNGAGAIPLPICSSDLSASGKCTKVNSSIGILDTDINGLISRIVQVTLGLSGGIFLLLIIRAGYRMISSQGNPEAIKDARESLTSAIVGFLFLIFSFVILELIGVHLLQLPGLS